jgi:hypothetical protein
LGYRTVEEIMAEYGAKGKHDDREYLQDVLVRLDWDWRQARRRLRDTQEKKETL